MTDMKQLLKDADPVKDLAAMDEESVMGMIEEVTTTGQQPRSRQGRLWVLATAAVFAAALVGFGTYAVTRDDGPAGTPPATATARAPMKLAVQGSGGTTMTSCMPFSVQILKDMPVAFSGTVSAVRDGAVTIQVDKWYRGGDNPQVDLTTTDAARVSLAGVLTFEAGKRYLITATNGNVNSCGFSGSWTPQLADSFTQAFG